MFTLGVAACLHASAEVRMPSDTTGNHGSTAVAIRHALIVGLWALLIALPLGLASQTVLKQIPNLVLSISILLLVISTGIVFDVIGVAVTAAREAPLHARAARHLFGARVAVRLVRKAHTVASFCNDVVGDVAGTLSGAIGISIVYQIIRDTQLPVAVAMTTVVSAFVATLTVGGKAYGKVFALRHSTDIVFQVGRLLQALSIIVTWMKPRGRRTARSRSPSRCRKKESGQKEEQG